MSKNIAIKETITNKRKATTLYPIKFDKAKEMAATKSIKEILIMYCCCLLNLYKRKFDNKLVIFYKCRLTKALESIKNIKIL